MPTGGVSPVVTVVSVPDPGVELFERIQVIVPPNTLLTVALNATAPPKQRVVGDGVVITFHVGSALTVTVVFAPSARSQPVPNGA